MTHGPDRFLSGLTVGADIGKLVLVVSCMQRRAGSEAVRFPCFFQPSDVLSSQSQPTRQSAFDEEATYEAADWDCAPFLMTTKRYRRCPNCGATCSCQRGRERNPTHGFVPGSRVVNSRMPRLIRTASWRMPRYEFAILLVFAYLANPYLPFGLRKLTNMISWHHRAVWVQCSTRNDTRGIVCGLSSAPGPLARTALAHAEILACPSKWLVYYE